MQTNDLGCLKWVPDTPEDELQVAFGRLKRAIRQQVFSGDDPAVFGILHAIATVGECRISTLADEVGLDISTVSRHVRSLESSGWIVRAEDPADRRATRLRLSEAGQSYLTTTLTKRSVLMRRAMRDWPDDDRQALTRLLTQLADDLSTTTTVQETL